jgi:hypothetical protein
VDTLPLDDAPETFGLSANADITLQQKETRDLMATLVSVQPRTGGGSGGRNPDDIVLELAVEIESKLPRPFSKDAAHPLTFATMADGSVNSLVSAILLPLFPLFFIPLRAPTRLCLRKRLLHALSPTLHPSVCGADSRRVPRAACPYPCSAPQARTAPKAPARARCCVPMERSARRCRYVSVPPAVVVTLQRICSPPCLHSRVLFYAAVQCVRVHAVQRW